MPDRSGMPRTDQASGLRRLFGARGRGPILLPFVTPDDGGDQAGFALGLASALVRQGRRVVVLDADEGGLAAALGLKPRYDLRHLLAGEQAVEAVALAASPGYRFVAAARALREAARQPARQAELERWLADSSRDCDALVACAALDTVGPLLIDEAREILLVCGAEPWQLARTYARLKSLHDRYPMRRFRIAYCPAESLRQAEAAHERLGRATARYLGLAIAFGGAIVSRADRDGQRAARGGALALSADDAIEQAFDDAAASLSIQPPVVPAPRPASPDPADAAFFSVVESTADVYGPRHA